MTKLVSYVFFSILSFYFYVVFLPTLFSFSRQALPFRRAQRSIFHGCSFLILKSSATTSLSFTIILNHSPCILVRYGSVQYVAERKSKGTGVVCQNLILSWMIRRENHGRDFGVQLFQARRNNKNNNNRNLIKRAATATTSKRGTGSMKVSRME